MTMWVSVFISYYVNNRHKIDILNVKNEIDENYNLLFCVNNL